MPEMPAPEAPVDEYPEHAKLRAISDRSQAIGEFLDWVQLPATEGGLGIVLTEHKCPHGYWPMSECEESKWCERGDETVQYWPTRTTTEAMLAQFFGIDRNRLEGEKRAMLEALRAANA